MSAFKGTPGPWKAQLYAGTSWSGGPYSKWEIFACDGPETYVAGANEDNDNAAENARLIAASPELLERHERDMAELELLAKAIGAGDPMPELVIRVTDLLVAKRAVIAKATGDA